MINVLIQRIINLIEEENDEREYHDKIKIDIPFKIAPIKQSISNIKYSELINDISKKEYYVYFDYDSNRCDYDYDRIAINLENENYRYIIQLGYEPRHWGYCECSEEDEGYDERYKCCGNGCDWDAPDFTVIKEVTLGSNSFNGIERDLWEYKDKYYNVTVKEKEEQERISKINYLKAEKERIEAELEKLNR